jgi:hypothetical protein
MSLQTTAPTFAGFAVAGLVWFWCRWGGLEIDEFELWDTAHVFGAMAGAVANAWIVLITYPAGTDLFSFALPGGVASGAGMMFLLRVIEIMLIDVAGREWEVLRERRYAE